MKRSQDQIFAESEGNKWFERNQQALNQFDPEADSCLRLIHLYSLRPRNVLEIGASNGVRLANISERIGSRCVALELSADATRDGKSRYRAVEFIQAGADAIPLCTRFDLIIVNFVFHWIDRANFLTCVAEIDRVLENNGFLIIGDFAPSNRVKVSYHHLPPGLVFTYKQDYAAVFLASGLYHLVAMTTGDHSSKTLASRSSEQERSGAWLLQKTLKEHYIESVLRPDKESHS